MKKAKAKTLDGKVIEYWVPETDEEARELEEQGVDGYGSLSDARDSEQQ